MLKAIYLLHTQLILLIGIVLGITLVVHLLLQRHTPPVTIAWLLAIIFLPYVGVPLYLFLGGRKVRRTTAKKGPLDLSGIDLPPSEGTGPIRHLLQAYGLPAPCGHNQLEMLGSGEDAYHRLVQLIDQAQQSIHIAIYVFAQDPVARDIRDRLVRKASEGIQVRLLLDGVGSLHTTHRFFRPLIKAGAKVAYFIPLLHRPFRGRTNLRNHRKIILIDNRSVWTGGRNIGFDYMGPAPARRRWRDLSFILQGPAVKKYIEVFRADWKFASGESIASPTTLLPCDAPVPLQAIVQVVPSGPDLPHDALYDAIVTMAFTAQRRLWIVSPYFVPDQALAQALEIAARRGVDVRILVPQRSNYILADWVRGCYLRELQRAGASIYLYTAGMLHAKLLLKDDDLAMIGSANMDVRSLFLDYEIAAFFYDQQSIEEVEAWTRETLQDCRRGALDVSMQRRLFEGVMHIIAPVV